MTSPKSSASYAHTRKESTESDRLPATANKWLLSWQQHVLLMWALRVHAPHLAGVRQSEGDTLLCKSACPRHGLHAQAQAAAQALLERHLASCMPNTTGLLCC